MRLGDAILIDRVISCGNQAHKIEGEKVRSSQF